jgi:hypothetical protein
MSSSSVCDARLPDKVTRIAFDPTGAWPANNGASDLTVWEFTGKGPRGRSPRLLRGHDTVTALAWRSGGTAVRASGGPEGGVCGRDVGRGVPGRPMRPTWRYDTGSAVTALAWLDTDTLIAATRTGHVLGVATPSDTTKVTSAEVTPAKVTSAVLRVPAETAVPVPDQSPR